MRHAIPLGFALAAISSAGVPPIEVMLAKLPLSFESNRGQTDPRVQFLSRGRGYTLFLTRTSAVIKLKDRGALRMTLAGANPKARVEGLERQQGNSNYFIGNDPAQWRTAVPNYAKVRVAEVYPGIDLVYYGNQRELEYDWVVKPGADPSRIRLEVDGAEIDLDAAGDLVMKTAAGEMRQRKPVVYQEAAGQRQPVEGRWVRRGKRGAAFEVARYDRTRRLVIDPIIMTFSTYLGGSTFDDGKAIAADAGGNVYVTGNTASTNFPTTNPFQALKGTGDDAFVTKFSADGLSRVYSTYLGGNSNDDALGIAVDSSGNAYVTGSTSSTNFPTANPVQAASGGSSDGFVTKLNNVGGALIYSTYLGGSTSDGGAAIAVDGSGNAYVTGITFSTNFPTAAPFQATKTGVSPDAFVTKLPPTGSPLTYSTYLGGSASDEGKGIAVDTTGIAYVTGSTTSTDFPTVVTPLQAANGGFEDAFVTKISANGATKLYSTYLGGNGSDIGYAIAIDASGNAYVTGSTESDNFPTVSAAQSAYGTNTDVFVTKLNSTGSTRLYSTFLGGTGIDKGFGIGVDGAGNALITGTTTSTDFPTANPLQGAYGTNTDAFLAKLNSPGSTKLYASYLGGSDYEQAFGIAVDANGNSFVTGSTESANFPTNLPLQGTFAGGSDVFVSYFTGNAPAAMFRDNIGGIQATSALSTSLYNAGGAFASDPAAGQNTSGGTWTAARDSGGAVWLNLLNRFRNWGSWLPAGGSMQGVPSVSVANGVIYIAARDTSGAYWIITYTSAGGFGTWTPLGGSFATDPVIAAAPGVTAQVYVVGKDSSNSIWTNVLSVPGGLSGWQLRGAVSQGKPSVTTGTDAGAYIAIRDPSNSVWMGYQTGTTFNGWQPGGATIAADPQIAASGGKLHVASLTGAGAVWYNTFNQGVGNNWVGWVNAGGTLSNIAVATNVGPQLFLTGRDPANQLWWYESPGRGWVFVGSPTTGSAPLSAAPR